MGTPAQAQEVGRLEEVIVTAQRRQESIQDVPIAISALDSDALRKQNIKNPYDLLGKVPSLNVSSSGNPRNAEVVTIRGQGATYLAPVGVVNYFAEVPLIQSGIIANQGGPGTWFDLSSLQVLRGPQGTLFGRNTTGGALLLEPKQPNEVLHGYLQAQAGNYQDREYEGAINIPVIDDTLMVRAAVQRVKRDGFTEDVGPNPFGYNDVCLPTAQPLCAAFAPGERGPGFAGKDYDNKDYWHARVGVLWRPTDRIENYLVMLRSVSEDNGTGFVFSGAGDGPNVANLSGNMAYGAGNVLAGNVFDPTITQGILAVQKQLGERKTAMNTDQFTRIEHEAYINKLSFELSDNLQVRNIISYQEMDLDYDWDLDGTLLPMLAQINSYILENDNSNPYGAAGEEGSISNSSQTTFELQLQGTALNDDLDYVLGTYYAKVEPEGLQGTGSFNAASLNTGTFYEQEITALAFYSQGTLNMGAFSDSLDDFRLTIGVRHTDDETDASRFTSNFYSDRVYSSPTEYELALREARQQSKEWTWTIGLDYQLSDSALFYGKVTRGYKAGGFNYAAPRQLTYEPELVTSYELGMKTDFALGTVPARLNLNLYSMDYDDIQRASADNFPIGNFLPDANDFNGNSSTEDFVCTGPNGEDFSANATCLDQGAVTFNADSARIQGVELEASIAPFENVEIAFNYSYTDAEYRDYDLTIYADPLRGGSTMFPCDGPLTVPSVGQADVVADYSCIPFQNTPEHIASLNFNYFLPLGENLGDLEFFASVNYQGETYSSATTSPLDDPGAWIDDYTTVNLSMEWNRLFGSNLDARAFVTNATDETYAINEYVGLRQSSGFTNTVYGEPRMYGISLRYRFGDEQ
ncbi:TonB-dependent receptor [Parahaliea mediterranea]|uniref:TonB-dependent receptor n=1 Tax=Parahaliea mediterranea TaxID=651086 RepID=UPI00147391DE|nr:TonB-dependent receptor [Parahaliea mediterranea]